MFMIDCVLVTLDCFDCVLIMLDCIDHDLIILHGVLRSCYIVF